MGEGVNNQTPRCPGWGVCVFGEELIRRRMEKRVERTSIEAKRRTKQDAERRCRNREARREETREERTDGDEGPSFW